MHVERRLRGVAPLQEEHHRVPRLERRPVLRVPRPGPLVLARAPQGDRDRRVEVVEPAAHPLQQGDGLGGPAVPQPEGDRRSRQRLVAEVVRDPARPRRHALDQLLAARRSVPPSPATGSSSAVEDQLAVRRSAAAAPPRRATSAAANISRRRPSSPEHDRAQGRRHHEAALVAELPGELHRLGRQLEPLLRPSACHRATKRDLAGVAAPARGSPSRRAIASASSHQGPPLLEGRAVSQLVGQRQHACGSAARRPRPAAAPGSPRSASTTTLVDLARRRRAPQDALRGRDRGPRHGLGVAQLLADGDGLPRRAAPGRAAARPSGRPRSTPAARRTGRGPSPRGPPPAPPAPRAAGRPASS